ncbi:MAG: M23 family metallopeptidase [Campylobacterota bacterium]|nr:M23 family metallopeptidase [Campylobacterota bacterium]
MRIFFVLIFFLSTLLALSIDVKNPDIANGKTVLIEFKKEKNIQYEKVKLDKKSYEIFLHPTDAKKMYALIPISYYKKPNIEELKIEYKTKDAISNAFFMLDIKDGKYKKEKLKVSSKKINPKSKAVKDRTAKEYSEAMKIYGTVTKQNYIDSKFIMPLESKITSAFGNARIYNGTLKGYHGGTDFRAKTPTPIKCSNDGKVVLAKDRFYAGNSVIVDHGHGIYSCYYHLSKFKVKNGDMVKKGQILGLSGSTGRITGPHLHFSIRVGGVQVDPLQFISLMNKNIFNGEKI